MRNLKSIAKRGSLDTSLEHQTDEGHCPPIISSREWGAGDGRSALHRRWPLPWYRLKASGRSQATHDLQPVSGDDCIKVQQEDTAIDGTRRQATRQEH